MTKKVKYFQVMPEAYSAMVGILTKLPYSEVADAIKKLEQQTVAVYDEPTWKKDDPEDVEDWPFVPPAKLDPPPEAA